ncbi:MAG TPA: hypothetical protein VFI17_00645 [Solirubrobacterales bacterium]|nr:hypothetical protein [Solirubrobacterales bacterium]
MSQPVSSSAAPYRPVPPRPVGERERAGLMAVADALIPDGSAGPRPSALEGYPRWLDRALAARRDCFEQVVALAARLAECPAEDLEAELRRLAADPDSGFEQLSAVIAGAYLIDPGVREAIGYPGQAQRPPRFDEAVEQIMDGVLDPVIERGRIYVDPATASAEGASR